LALKSGTRLWNWRAYAAAIAIGRVQATSGLQEPATSFDEVGLPPAAGLHVKPTQMRLHRRRGDAERFRHFGHAADFDARGEHPARSA
jgi:hypothetical protein